MFADSSVLSFFPTFVWVHDIQPADYEPMNAEMSAALKKMMGGNITPETGRILQSESNLHTLPEFQRLGGFAREAIDKTLDFLNLERLPYQITGCWANVGGPGAVHKEHAHPNNYLSGVYYLKAPAGGNSITFRDPRTQAHMITGKEKAPTPMTASAVTIDIQAGRLVLFPAWLLHRVDRNASDEARVSIAFNMMFSSYAQEISGTKWTSQFGSA